VAQFHVAVELQTFLQSFLVVSIWFSLMQVLHSDLFVVVLNEHVEQFDGHD
jgi:hypothetical protein